MITVACVRTGAKYGVEYVYRLKRATDRFLTKPHRFVCITDYPKDLPDLEIVEVQNLPGWWGKMKLFDPEWRQGERVLYLDLDSVIVGNLDPLADLDISFGICANFTVLYQRRKYVMGGTRETWPCKYGSMCMLLGPQLNGTIWKRYNADAAGIRERAGLYGDQKALEEIEPNATLLQSHLPEGFFLGYRDLPKYPNGPPDGAAVVVFAGKNKPHNTECKWARDAWLNQ